MPYDSHTLYLANNAPLRSKQNGVVAPIDNDVSQQLNAHVYGSQGSSSNKNDIKNKIHKYMINS